MDLQLLEYFLRVAELGSINRAAADLHVSQAALSRHVAALEQEMGTPLFTRSRTGVRLTEPGRLLFERSRPLLRQFAMLKEQVGDTASGQLSIGVPPAWHSVFTVGYVERLMLESPQIKLRVHSGVSHGLQDLMFAGALDLCISPFAASVPAGFNQVALVREPMVLILGAQKDSGPGEPVALERLQGSKLILPTGPSVVRSLLEHMLTRKGIRYGSVVETDSLSLSLSLARREAAMTVVPACAVIDPHGGEGCAWSPIRGLYLTWALMENKARSHAGAVREGRRQLLNTMKAISASRIWHGLQVLGTLDKTKDSAATS